MAIASPTFVLETRPTAEFSRIDCPGNGDEQPAMGVVILLAVDRTHVSTLHLCVLGACEPSNEEKR